MVVCGWTFISADGAPQLIGGNNAKIDTAEYVVPRYHGTEYEVIHVH